MVKEPRGVLAWAAIFAAAGLAWFAIIAQGPPEALPAEAATDVFSSGRAMQHVERIAVEPHPMGSSQAVKVRDYLKITLEGLGLSPEEQTFQVENVRGTAARTGTNLLARVKGSGPSGKKALMICTHYD